MKNWIEWTNKISKIWEKIRTRTYFKFLHIVSRLWADCERQSRGKSKWSRKTSHNVSGIPLTIRVFISVHNLLTMWVTMWAEFRSHCDSQYQMTSGIFSQYLHIPIFCLDRAMISNSNCQLVLIIWGWEITVFLQDKEESRAKFTIEMILMKFWDTFVS